MSLGLGSLLELVSEEIFWAEFFFSRFLSDSGKVCVCRRGEETPNRKCPANAKHAQCMQLMAGQKVKKSRARRKA